MNRSYNELESIVISLINFNQKQQKHFATMQENLSQLSYSKEFQTVRLNPGRQCGKSTIIAKLSSTQDLIIARDFTSLKNIKERVNFFNIGSHAEVKMFSNLEVNRTETYDTVWIDDASFNQNLESIYELLSGKCKQFILLG